jgi:tRNA A-37 threonylcarbamoyl transferase component Bud32
MEQTYGYLVRESKKYGVLTTMNGWMFMYREDKGKLFTTGIIPCSQQHPQPTIREMLYYISAMAAAYPTEDETDEKGNKIKLQAANGRRPDAAPRLPRPKPQPPVPEPSKPGGHHLRSHGNRRVLTLQPAPDFPDLLFEPSIASKQLGCKTFLATFMPEDLVVVGKFWDSWKETSDARDKEVEIYMQLQSLWGSIVPRFFGCAEYEWHYTMFVERIEVTPSQDRLLTNQGNDLAAENLTPKVEQNLWAAFKEIHELGVVHGDIRNENVLVRDDESVWIIDFEMSMNEGVTEEDIEDENACIDYMLAKLKKAKTFKGSDRGSADVVDVAESLKEIKVGEEAQGEMEIPDIARMATPMIPGKTPEGTDGEEEDSESSDTDSTW